MAAMNIVNTSTLALLCSLVIVISSLSVSSNAAPLNAGSGGEFTVRIIHTLSGYYFAVVDGNLTLVSPSNNDETTLFKQTTPSAGTVRFESACAPGVFLLLVEDSNTWPRIEAGNTEGSSGSGSSTQTQSDWEVLTTIVDGLALISLRVTSTNGNNCYLAAEFDPASLDFSVAPNPCNGFYETPTGMPSTLLSVRQATS